MAAIDRLLLNQGRPGSSWGNLGLWTQGAMDYPAACEALALRLAQAGDLRPGCSVLDVGFGHGDQLRLWKERFQVGRIHGMETDAKGLAEARRKLAVYADVTLQLSPGGFAPPAEQHERVLALDCAYHFAPRSAFFAQAFQTLTEGGVLALTDIVLADGSASRHAMLAKACGIPQENLLTQQAYAQSLTALGFKNPSFESLDDAVLGGFSRYARRLLQQRGVAMLNAGGLKILATASIAAWLRRGQHIHYMLVRVER